MSVVPFDRALQQKYDRPGPRYTSYPTAPQFHHGFDAVQYAAAALESNAVPLPRPLSLYVHVPFCESLCYYCACNKIVTRHRGKADVYLDYIERELALQAALFDGDRTVQQLHLGGGTPTYLSARQLWRLMQSIAHHFRLAAGKEREFSIEIDPRAVDEDTMEVLAELGFNRISLGVQDFDPRVQAAVNRLQSEEETRRVIEQARTNGVHSISLDLIYGLPLQTVKSFDATLDRVLDIRPDRLSIYSYAHLPERVRAQRLIRTEDLPPAGEKLSILGHSINRLNAAGYRTIGMDHFALPDNELSRAMDAGTLQRNFQGYSTHADCDLIGIGVTAIGKVADSYSQNVKHLNRYYAELDAGRLPLERGVLLDFDDRLRRAVIEAVMCRWEVDYASFEDDYNIAFQDYFAPELVSLDEMESDGLVTREPGRLRIQPRGRLLLRNVAMVFDRYLRTATPIVQYSRTV
ncbi:oxygen-independent coproporphyrinogen-3 oxidase [Natronocella acetinitrilica]|uniref:Coproporphyrinogen-III oxidase n=1 Tax=Natronocella acetinitrilica TaxID=414046 RepID=A0AAE3G3X9_9GAMM|nr:oxygen-independent coproporphyrinogen III oxidase [Natronocella acetinitrilica]MCP1674957.1 oxygen-independent coproporphyrinogen-3 oxidase [Natronocella acetinitrilica]